MNITRIIRAFRSWLPLAIAITGICGLMYLAVHQNYRSSLNDPQIQIARDTTEALAQGANPASLVPNTQTDIATSLSPYIIIYNNEREPLLSSAILEGKTPTPPAGVFAAAKQYGENRITWQPQPGVRSAIVVRPYNNATQSGFILVGRGMHEVEQRISNLGFMTGGAWLTVLLFSFLAILML